MYNWKKIVLNQTSTMKEAIDVLNNESLRIVLVVDQANRLTGTITDGDIRRALLRRYAMDTKLLDFMCTEPTVANTTENREEILQKMNSLDLLQIPIIDHDRRVVGLETLQHLIEKERYDNPVFLMAGGFGTRLSPLTEHVPKPMLNVGSKPILETILEQFIDAGFHNFYISTHYKADIIRDHFGNGSNWDVHIQYVHEEEPLGTAGALGLLPNEVIELPILMMNGDVLTKVDFKQLLDFHCEHDVEATMCVREYDFQVPYGVIEGKDQYVTNIVEKPVHKFFINAGIYVLNASILGNIDGSKYIDMPHLLGERIGNNKEVAMFPLHEYWLDIGRMEQYDQAQIDSKALF